MFGSDIPSHWDAQNLFWQRLRKLIDFWFYMEKHTYFKVEYGSVPRYYYLDIWLNNTYCTIEIFIFLLLLKKQRSLKRLHISYPSIHKFYTASNLKPVFLLILVLPGNPLKQEFVWPILRIMLLRRENKLTVNEGKVTECILQLYRWIMNKKCWRQISQTDILSIVPNILCNDCCY